MGIQLKEQEKGWEQRAGEGGEVALAALEAQATRAREQPCCFKGKNGFTPATSFKMTDE